MLRRSASRFLLALAAAGSLAAATPAWAHDPYRDRRVYPPAGGYDYDYEHALADRHADYHHSLRDRHRDYDHVQRDFYKYGTTSPYSSPGHYFRDQIEHYNHHRRDLHDSYDHYLRDRDFYNRY